MNLFDDMVVTCEEIIRIFYSGSTNPVSTNSRAYVHAMN